MSGGEELASALGAFAATAEPPRSVDAALFAAVADCIGCIMGGAESEVAARVRAGLGEPGSVAVLGTGDKAPAGLAALRMAVAGHAYDFDDWEEPGNTHPSVIMVPAIWAVAHLRPVTGARFRAAYAVGFEVIARLGLAIGLSHYARGFHTTATLGAIGAAAAASRALSLGVEETTNALSLAASQALGYTAQFGSNAKPLQAGAAARAGVEAALLAQAGCTAQPQVMGGARGMAGLLGDHDPARIDSELKRLGAPWALDEFGVVLKPWPSCGYTHRLMTAALELRDEIGDARITGVEAELPDFHRAILPFDTPQSRNEALFSIPACVSQILVEGDLTVKDGADGFWTAPAVRELAGCVAVTAAPARRPELNYDPDQPDKLVIHAGRRFETECAYPLGAPQNPMDDAQLAAKFCGLTGLPANAHRRVMALAEAPDILDHLKEALT